MIVPDGEQNLLCRVALHLGFELQVGKSVYLSPRQDSRKGCHYISRIEPGWVLLLFDKSNALNFNACLTRKFGNGHR